MSSLTLQNGAAEHRYRDTTNGQRSMPGVSMPSFKCPRCKEFRRTRGRKKIDGRWRCEKCVEELKGEQQ